MTQPAPSSHRRARLDSPPVVRPFLVVEVPDAGDVRRVAIPLRPGDRFILPSARVKDVVGVIFDNVVIDAGAIGPTLRAGLNIYGCHAVSPLDLTITSKSVLDSFTESIGCIIHNRTRRATRQRGNKNFGGLVWKIHGRDTPRRVTAPEFTPTPTPGPANERPGRGAGAGEIAAATGWGRLCAAWDAAGRVRSCGPARGRDYCGAAGGCW
jgi:hypothetical protein